MELKVKKQIFYELSEPLDKHKDLDPEESLCLEQIHRQPDMAIVVIELSYRQEDNQL